MSNPNVLAEINRMVADSAGRADLQHTAAVAFNPAFAGVSIQGDQGDVSFNSATGETTVHRAPSVSTGAATRIADDGRSIEGTVQQLNANRARLQAQLDDHYFDAKGQKQFVYTGADRVNIEKQLAQHDISARYETDRLNALAAQRAADAAARAMPNESELFHGGSPERKAMLAKAVDEERARQLAARIVRGEAR